MAKRSRGKQKAGVRLEGPWPFVTLRSHVDKGRRRIWRSRQTRKGLLRFERGEASKAVPFWQGRIYNWVIGLFFSIGALLFMTGAALSLLPPNGSITPSPVAIALVFFAGSIPFTTAAYMQHFQSANAPDLRHAPRSDAGRKPAAYLSWRPGNPGWLSTFCQFIGTIAFNFNTFDAIHPAQDWVGQDVTIWLPGLIGSVLFLASAYLAFIEICHRYWAWKPRDLDWWIAFVNLIGCIFFMTAGILAFVPDGPEPGWIAVAANIHLGLGAACFLIGAVLLMHESRQAAPAPAEA